MKFSYEDLISGDSIFVNGVAHLKPPKLKELKPTEGIGMWTYNFYLNMLIWDKEDFLNFLKDGLGKQTEKLKTNDKILAYDIITLLNTSRELLQNAMAFFINEKMEWDSKQRCFFTYSKNDDSKVGVINRENFEEVRDMMLQINFINIGDRAKPVKHSSTKAQQMWEMAQEYLKKENKKKPSEKNTNLGNVVSKLCAANTGYTLLNIYDLTVFQLYDQFFQYGYLRMMDLSDMAYSNHGGKEFDMQAWLKPTIKI